MRTGVVYDPLMAKYSCLWDDTYVENPERFLCVMRRCEELGLIERCHRLQSRRCTREELKLCHDEELLDLLESTAAMDVDHLKEVSSKFDCLYIHQDSWDAALLSAGAAIDLVTSVVNREVDNGMAIVRPPGHHAMRSDSCGYCYVNNVAIAARTALGMGLERILIVDWDVHHGQGTQREFYNDPRVMYVSIHRFEYGGWWPNLRESDYDYIGDGAGAGYNVNIPLNITGNTDSDYLGAWHNVVLPVATEFDPQLVLVSAGFDPAVGCPEGEQQVTPACFAHFTHSLQGLADGAVCTILEGGYFPPSLAEGAALTLRSLLGDPCPYLPYPVLSANVEMLTTITNVQIALSAHWATFSDKKGQALPLPVWKGPSEPEQPPFDIMCPTPPRPVEEEEHWVELVKQLVKSTDLAAPEINLTVSEIIGKNIAGINITDEAAKLVVNRTSKAAIVDSFEIVKGALGMEQTKILAVKYEISSSTRRKLDLPGEILCISIKESDDKIVVTADTDEILVGDRSLVQLTNKVLLPLSYQFSPSVVLLLLGPPVKSALPVPRDLHYLVHQMRTVGEGKMIVVMDTEDGHLESLISLLM